GVVSPQRDLALILAVVRVVRSAARGLAILVCVDGLAIYVTALPRVFPVPARTSRRGRPRGTGPGGGVRAGHPALPSWRATRRWRHDTTHPSSRARRVLTRRAACRTPGTACHDTASTSGGPSAPRTSGTWRAFGTSRSSAPGRAL